MRPRVFNGLLAFITAISSISVLGDNTIDTPNTHFDLSFVNAVSQNNSPSILIDKFTATARIITAISLQNGLSDGSIPVDSAIAELLNIGPEDMENIVKFNQSNVDSFIGILKESESLESTVNEEKSLAEVYELKRIWKKAGESINMPSKEQYKKLDGIEKLVTTKISDFKFEPIITALSKSNLTDGEVTQLNTSLTTFITDIEKVMKKEDLKEVIEVLEQLKPLSSISRVFSIYDQTGYLNTGKMSQSTLKGLKNGFDGLVGLISAASTTSFNTILKLTSSRFGSHRTDRVHTTGFLNGFKDIDKLTADTSDKWISSLPMIAPSLPGIQSLVALTPSLKTLDDKWVAVSNPRKYESVKHVAGFQKVLFSMKKPPSWNDIESLASAVSGCSEAFPNSALTSNLIEIADNVKVSLRKLHVLQDMQQLGESIKSETIPKLSSQTSSEEIKKFKESVLKLETDRSTFLKGKTFDKLKMKSANSEDITDFKNKHSDYIKAFDCVTNLSIISEDIGLSVQALSKIREFKTELRTLYDLNEVSGVIAQTSDSLNSIRSKFESFKATVPYQIKALSGMKEISKPFGEAVTLLVSAEKTSEKAAEFVLFEKNGKLLGAQMDANKDHNFKRLFKEKWGNIGETTQEIQDMLAGITGWIDKIIVADNATLEELGAVFTGAPKLVDVDLLVDGRNDVIESFEKLDLAPEQKVLTADFKKTLMELSKLDLKFARFQKSAESMKTTISRVLEVLKTVDYEEKVIFKPDFDISKEYYSPITFYVFIGLQVFNILCFLWVLMCLRSDARRRREYLEQLTREEKKAWRKRMKASKKNKSDKKKNKKNESHK